MSELCEQFAVQMADDHCQPAMRVSRSSAANRLRGLGMKALKEIVAYLEKHPPIGPNDKTTKELRFCWTLLLGDVVIGCGVAPPSAPYGDLDGWLVWAKANMVR